MLVLDSFRERRTADVCAYGLSVGIAHNVVAQVAEVAVVYGARRLAPFDGCLTACVVYLQTCERHLVWLVVAYVCCCLGSLALARCVRERNGEIVQTLWSCYLLSD